MKIVYDTRRIDDTKVMASTSLRDAEEARVESKLMKHDSIIARGTTLKLTLQLRNIVRSHGHNMNIAKREVIAFIYLA